MIKMEIRHIMLAFLALIGFLNLVGVVLTQQGDEGPACQFTGWNFNNTQCPNETRHELYSDVDIDDKTLGNRLCCNLEHEDFKDMKNLAYSCRTTSCQPSTSQEPCASLDPRFIDKGEKKLEYEEILRESCARTNNGSGVTALCCVRNSTEGFLATMLGAESNEFPHQVKLKLGCGGTVYNSRFVITAAHCVVSARTREVVSTKGMEVVLGSNIGEIKAKEYIYGVKRIIPHPGYSWLKGNAELESRVPRIFNDIALMELDREIGFGDKIKALQIAPKDFVPMKYSDKAVIVGWGTTDTLDLSVHLQKTNFLLRSDQSCYRNEEGPYEELRGYEDQLLCVGGVFEGKYSPTAGGGDSGGPAICRGPNGRALLCGVTSFGGDDELCKVNTDEENCIPSTYAEVAHFHDWIKKTAGDQDPKTFYQPFLYGRRIQKLSEHEHQVHITSTNGKPCGGTLIAPDVVITAAQCLRKDGNNSTETFSNLTVTFGLNEVTGKGQPFQVKGVAVLPGFQLDRDLVTASKVENRVIVSDNYYKNDLAVIKLTRPVPSPTTFPKLPKQGYHPRGLGYELAFPRNTTYSAQMSQRQFRLLNRGDCQRRMDRMSRIGFNFKIDKDILCGVESYSGGSTCDRELGGGVLCKGEGEGGKYDTLCGVQIFRLCEFSIPNGFINVALKSDWIQKVMGQL